VHELKLTIVAFACAMSATKNISMIEKAPEKVRACAYNFKELLGKLKRVNMITAAIETELRKPIKGCNKTTLEESVLEIPDYPHGVTLWTKWAVIKSKLMNVSIPHCLGKEEWEEKLGSGKGLTGMMWNLVLVKIYMGSPAYVSFVQRSITSPLYLIPN
jgi:hypothetical protein